MTERKEPTYRKGVGYLKDHQFPQGAPKKILPHNYDDHFKEKQATSLKKDGSTLKEDRIKYLANNPRDNHLGSTN